MALADCLDFRYIRIKLDNDDFDKVVFTDAIGYTVKLYRFDAGNIKTLLSTTTIAATPEDVVFDPSIHVGLIAEAWYAIEVYSGASFIEEFLFYAMPEQLEVTAPSSVDVNKVNLLRGLLGDNLRMQEFTKVVSTGHINQSILRVHGTSVVLDESDAEGNITDVGLLGKIQVDQIVNAVGQITEIKGTQLI